MKILLDEDLPHQLRHEIAGHRIFSLQRTWDGQAWRMAICSSALADAGFNALITNDRGLEYEQDQSMLPLAVVVLILRENTIEASSPSLSTVGERAWKSKITRTGEGDLTRTV